MILGLENWSELNTGTAITCGAVWNSHGSLKAAVEAGVPWFTHNLCLLKDPWPVLYFWRNKRSFWCFIYKQRPSIYNHFFLDLQPKIGCEPTVGLRVICVWYQHHIMVPRSENYLLSQVTNIPISSLFQIEIFWLSHHSIIYIATYNIATYNIATVATWRCF